MNLMSNTVLGLHWQTSVSMAADGTCSWVGRTQLATTFIRDQLKVGSQVSRSHARRWWTVNQGNYGLSIPWTVRTVTGLFVPFMPCTFRTSVTIQLTTDATKHCIIVNFGRFLTATNMPHVIERNGVNSLAIVRIVHGVISPVTDQVVILKSAHLRSRYVLLAWDTSVVVEWVVLLFLFVCQGERGMCRAQSVLPVSPMLRPKPIHSQDPRATYLLEQPVPHQVIHSFVDSYLWILHQ